MQSICPKCHFEIEHEDYLFEVSCSCGARFNPFMTTQDSGSHINPPQETANEVVKLATPLSDQRPKQVGKELAKDLAKDLAKEPPKGQEKIFENEAAFSAIREFGENIGHTAAPSMSRTPQKYNGISVPCLAGHEVPHQPTLEVIASVSVKCELTHRGEPLMGTISALCEMAKGRGGNALIDFRWQVLNDSRTVIASATAVLTDTKTDTKN